MVSNSRSVSCSPSISVDELGRGRRWASGAARLRGGGRSRRARAPPGSERKHPVAVALGTVVEDVGELRVGVSDHAVAPVDELVVVLLGCAEEAGEDADGQLLRDLLDEVELPSGSERSSTSVVRSSSASSYALTARRGGPTSPRRRVCRGGSVSSIDSRSSCSSSRSSRFAVLGMNVSCPARRRRRRRASSRTSSRAAASRTTPGPRRRSAKVSCGKALREDVVLGIDVVELGQGRAPSPGQPPGSGASSGRSSRARSRRPRDRSRRCRCPRRAAVRSRTRKQLTHTVPADMPTCSARCADDV